MDFSRLQAWAERQGNNVAAIVSNAGKKARYEKPETADDFRSALAAEWARRGGAAIDSEKFLSVARKVCAKFQRKGEAIPSDRIPRRVCRVLRKSQLERYTANALGIERSAKAVRLSGPKYVWKNAARAVTIRGKALKSVAIRLAGGKTDADRGRAVFVAFEVESNAESGKASRPHNALWERLLNEAGGYQNLAAHALWVLGLDATPAPPPADDERVFAEYRSDRFEDWRFPTPPDGRDNPLFRPVHPESAWRYGRTFCRGATQDDWDSGKVGTNEAVHENEKLDLRLMDIVRIGEA